AVLRFPNFAIGAHAALGAYAGYVANVGFHWPLPLAFLAAFAVAGILGAGGDRAIVAPLRQTGALTAAIGTIALAICIENVLRFFFGNGLHSYDVPVLRDLSLGPVHVGPQALENALVAGVVMVAVFALLRFTRIGKAMRAVADDPTLAAIKGIDPARIATYANLGGMGLAGLGGMLLAIDSSVSPTTGLDIILPIFAAAVVGGLGSIPGAVVGALAVGIAEGLSLLVVSPEYRGAIGFAAILLMLTLRPRGLLGAREF
ncbi:MAG: branched-chain amino acid ABC transporter permease, partial [Candidatus Eremiobacteraeota bacterium]|nr:branched-chain amino acid ABC transporter permease [Candidatus Eremiobacteraeota bacterium]